jgi:hypothetical protein
MKTMALMLSFLLIGGGASVAQSAGRSAEETACRPDVRRFCHRLHPDAGDNAFLECLQANRAKLSPKCRSVLESNGV